MRRRPKWTLGPEVAAWIELFCVHGPGDVLGQPVSLTREEKRFLAWAYEVDKDGSRIVRRAVRGLRDGTFEIFQLDATAYPGNSGGPLFDPQTGEVMGVMNMVLIKGTRESALSQPSGISYAIPAVHVKELLARSAQR